MYKKVSLSTIFIILVIPEIYLVIYKYPGLSTGDQLRIFFSIASLLCWFSIFHKRMWLGAILLLPLVVTIPVSTHYIANYAASPISVNLLATSMESDITEFMEFLGWNAPKLYMQTIVLTIAYSLIVYTIYKYDTNIFYLNRNMSYIVLSTIFIFLPVGTIAASIFLQSQNHTNTIKIVEPEALDRFRLKLESSYNVFPFGVIPTALSFMHYKSSMSDNLAKLADFRFGASLPSENTASGQRQIYVLVIGESSRRDHWQIFGYDRPTTPNLAREPNLVPISNMISAYTQTRLALPVMLTRKPANWVSPAPWPEASIVRAMQEAGFETWWLSMQGTIGPHDSAVALHAHEADHQRWLGQLSKPDDGELVPHLQEAITTSDKNKNLFIVLHTMGSHTAYDQRYPAGFTHFRPTITEADDSDTPLWQRVHNSYDNTISYTDHILSRIIAILKDEATISALWYTSDHGETLPSPTCNYHAHGHQSLPEYTVPAIFWHSDLYARIFPQRVHTIRHNADQKTMSQDIFPSLLDMAGVRIPGREADRKRSLFSTSWEPHTRWIGQHQLMDFDQAEILPGCMDLRIPATETGTQ